MMDEWAEGLAYPPEGEVVLVVEDEATLRSLFVETLREQGYRVIEAPDGQAALEHCQNVSQAIDLVLTDVVMPKISGPELAARLASIRPDTKLVYMSAYANRGQLGPLDAVVLQKPFGPDALLATVREALGVRKGYDS